MDHLQHAVMGPGDMPAQTGMASLTLKDVMDRVGASADLAPARRREMLSAVRTAARCIGSDVGDILAQPASLSKKLRDAPHGLAGVGERRWAAVRGLTLAALRVSGFRVMSGRRTRLRLSPAWEALHARAPDRQCGIGLSRFMSFCTAEMIEPDAVDLPTFHRFQEALESNSLVRDAPFVYRTTCAVWNKASRSVADWPLLEVPVPNRSRTYSLDWNAFPASFQADVEAFLSHTGNQDPLADDYAPSVRPATIVGRRKQIQLMATALAESGFATADIISLTTLVHADNAKRVLQFFLDRVGVGRETVYAHAILLRTLARHWVARDEQNILKLEKFCKGLTPKKHGMTDKNRGRLRQFDDPRNVDALLGLPAKLLREAQRKDVGGQEELVGIVYAVAIELLIMAPIRIKNLTELDIERHIVQTRRGSHAVVHLVIPGEEVKNGVPFEVALPKASGELLTIYLRDYRPRISSAPSPWLFPNSAGQKRNAVGFGRHISDLIERHTGLKMHPHLFRHLSAKFVLEAHPEGIEICRLVLGHKSTRTTLRAYSEGKTASAHKRFESIIDAKRLEALGRSSKKPRARVSA